MLLFLLRSLESTQLSHSILISALTVIPQLFPGFLPPSKTLATWAPRLPHQAEPKALQRVTLYTHPQWNSGSSQAHQPCLLAKWVSCLSVPRQVTAAGQREQLSRLREAVAARPPPPWKKRTGEGDRRGQERAGTKGREAVPEHRC